jgi:hypothetical protein
MDTPTLRTDAEITFSAAYTCTNHNDRQRAECPVCLVCLVSALSTERDQLRAEVEQKRHLLAVAIKSAGDQATRAEAAQTVALAQWNGALERAMKAEAALAELHASFAGNVHTRCNQLVAELATEREKAERYRLTTLKLDAELDAERARLDAGTILLTVAGERVWHCGVDLRAAIDAAMKEGAK